MEFYNIFLMYLVSGNLTEYCLANVKEHYIPALYVRPSVAKKILATRMCRYVVELSLKRAWLG